MWLFLFSFAFAGILSLWTVVTLHRFILLNQAPHNPFSKKNLVSTVSYCEPIFVLAIIIIPIFGHIDFVFFCLIDSHKFPHRRYSYFILLTSKSEKNEIAHGLENDTDYFLTKPVNAHELRAHI